MISTFQSANSCVHHWKKVHEFLNQEQAFEASNFPKKKIKPAGMDPHVCVLGFSTFTYLRNYSRNREG